MPTVPKPSPDSIVAGAPVTLPELAFLVKGERRLEPNSAILDLADREALEEAFRDWCGRWDHALALGGTGDVFELLAALIAASPNACMSAKSISKAS